MSLPGTFRPFSNVRHSVVVGGKPDTQTGHRDRAKMERMTQSGYWLPFYSTFDTSFKNPYDWAKGDAMELLAEQPRKRRAIVIGGSIAGLFVGAFLRRIGWQVDIYERSSIELIGRGVGIFASHLELFEALDKCGAGTVDIGVIVYKRITFDRSGKVIAEKPLLQIVTSWDRLRQVLLKVIDRHRYHF